ALKPPQAPAVERVNGVERAVVGAEVDDVELRVVEGLALDRAERLEAPDRAPVARAKRVEPVVARADEESPAPRIDLRAPALVGLADAPRVGGERPREEHVKRAARPVKPLRPLGVDPVVARVDRAAARTGRGARGRGRCDEGPDERRHCGTTGGAPPVPPLRLSCSRIFWTCGSFMSSPPPGAPDGP